MMEWLDEIEKRLTNATPKGSPMNWDDIEARYLFNSHAEVDIAKLIAAVRMAEKALGYFERGSFVNDSASSGYAKHISAKLQSGEFGNEP